MEDVKKFEPNWFFYGVALGVFVLTAGIAYSMLGLSPSVLGFFSILPVAALCYLCSTQNRLELSPDCIVEKFLLPLHSANIIKIENIEWVALVARGIGRYRQAVFLAPSRNAKPTLAIIKPKNGKVVEISLALLRQNQEAVDYFHDLCGQMVEQDTNLLKLHDLQGFNRLVIDATLGLTDLVEALQDSVTRVASKSTRHPSAAPSLKAQFFRGARAITSLTGGGIDTALAQLALVLNKKPSRSASKTAPSPEREAILAALNGVLGDYMAVTNNSMTLSMRLRRDGRSLQLTSQAIGEAITPHSSKVVILVHGLCMSDLQWRRQGHDHGAALARDLGYTPVYLRYNSGLHISTNGRALSDLLEILVKLWPVPIKELVLIGHSMGGLLSRSTCYYAEISGHHWLRKLRKLVFLGSPHHGAPLERGSNWVGVILGATPYTAPLARIGKVRSAGITDLRYGNVIDEHWQGRDRFEHSHDSRMPVPLPRSVPCFTIAATTGKKAGDRKGRLLGDGLVQVNSALGKHSDPRLTLLFPEDHQWLGYGLNHMDLLNHPAVYAQIQRWLTC